MNYPTTKREVVTEELHGHVITDPYRWLEDSDSEATKIWIKEQNACVDSKLRKGSFENFSDELARNFKVISFSNPVMRGGKYFFTERQPDEDQAAIYYKESLTGKSIKLIDPNGMNESNTVTIDFWFVSKNGKYLAYGLSQKGDEMATLYIKDVETGNDLPDQIERCRYSRVRWLPDESGFYYTRNPRKGTVPQNEEHLHSKIYFHKIGDNPEHDVLIWGKDRPKDDMLGISLSRDGRYLGIHVSHKWSENELYVYDRETRVITPLVTGVSALFSLNFMEDKAIIQTNYKANNKRVLWASFEKLFTPIETWQELIKEREFLLENIAITKSKLIAEYTVNASSLGVVFDHQGIQQGEIHLPSYSTLIGISSHQEEEEYFYSVDSFVFPKIVYRYDPQKNSFEEYRKIDNPINPDDYIVKQEWYSSKDSTSIPLYIFHRKDVSSGPKATILYGYGGFASSVMPSFWRNFVPWLERGGVVAVANIRGGGEFGERWHEQGIKNKKQNSFDDFIAAAEYLISRGYTSLERLGILGGSNGGLLVSAVSTQRPELFRAVCSRVPLTDMVRFPMFGMASRWVHEYGDPAIKDDLMKILTWSPYHTVKEGVEYPATLFTTAEKDTRVNPLHARKMAALLQSVNKKNTVLIFTDTEAGHGPGKPVKKIVEDQALVLNFFTQELRLE